MRKLLLLVALTLPVLAQSSAVKVTRGSSLPSKCLKGREVFYLEDNGGITPYICVDANTWSDGMKSPVVVTSGDAGQTIMLIVGGIYVNDTAGAITYNLPTPIPSLKICVRNSATRTGAITLRVPTGVTIDKDGAAGSSGGTIASAGALGDSACIVGQSSTQYLFFDGKGTWTPGA